jgi:amphi-Trp domain-containing protein
MRRDKNSFRHDSLQDAQSISNILDAITEGVAKGKLVFSDEDDKIVLNPDGLLELKITASQEGDRQKVNIRIGWQVTKGTKKKKKQLSVSS